MRALARSAIGFVHRALPRYKLDYGGRGVLNFIDVGSVGGLPKPWMSNANQIKFLLNFEPNDSPARGPNSLTYNTALWESDATLPFYQYASASGSSLFRQNIEFVKQNYESLKVRGPKHLADTWFERSALKEITTIKCRALDNVLAEALPDIPFHFMKIDAQGAEHQILLGARSLLSTTCIGLHLELFTTPLYEGIKLLDEVETFLLGFGFRLALKFPAHGSFASQHDCLFLKDASPTVLPVITKAYGLKP